IARSPVPVVSGVGHEIDITIADLAADVRAPTPSAAAELAVPDRAALQRELGARFQRLRAAAVAQLGACAVRLGRARDTLRAHAPTVRLAAQRQRWWAATRALRRVALARAERARGRLQQLAGRLDTLSPLAVLGRGYALVRCAPDGRIVRTAADVDVGDRLAIRVSEAEIEAAVEAVRRLSGDGKTF
ncbi:MAG TPA: exodeoxyribonuclease VII large subunit, partial [Myxococcota bacterium]